MADMHGPTDIGQADFRDVFVETGDMHGQQHPKAPHDRADAKGRNIGRGSVGGVHIYLSRWENGHMIGAGGVREYP
ncbi:hypothetical protein AA11826_2134 [Komagataeibacter oboediens DSM 11826]|nr:hypothetical protein AA11826_2134 [Komagataeibacter oboediens DSM 11826]